MRAVTESDVHAAAVAQRNARLDLVDELSKDASMLLAAVILTETVVLEALGIMVLVKVIRR